MTLQEHLIKGCSDFIKGSSSLNATKRTKFGVHRHCGGRSNMFLVYYVASCEHVFKQLFNFEGGSFS